MLIQKGRFFMKHNKIWLSLAALLLVAALSACGGNPSSQPEESSEPSSIESSSLPESSEESSVPEETISAEEAEDLARERAPVDFDNGYTLSPEAEDLEEDGKRYYQFTVTGGEEDFTVLVDQQDGSVLTRYPDGNTYTVEEDPTFQLTPSQWGGIYATDNGNILSIELMDNNSFEFTLTAGNDTLEAETGRIVSGNSSQAEYTGADGLRLRFSHDGESIQVIAEDSAGGAFEGTYHPDR